MLKGLPTDREGFRVKSNTQFSQRAESYLFILRTSPLTRSINQPSPTIKRLASPYSSLTNGGPFLFTKFSIPSQTRGQPFLSRKRIPHSRHMVSDLQNLFIRLGIII